MEEKDFFLYLSRQTFTTIVMVHKVLVVPYYHKLRRIGQGNIENPKLILFVVSIILKYKILCLVHLMWPALHFKNNSRRNEKETLLALTKLSELRTKTRSLIKIHVVSQSQIPLFMVMNIQTLYCFHLFWYSVSWVNILLLNNKVMSKTSFKIVKCYSH